MFVSAPPARTRTAHRAAREAAILHAALKCFAERGYDGARIEDIADLAGIGNGTLYVYFSFKKALLEGVVRAAPGPGLTALSSLAAADDESPEVILRSVIDQARRALAHPEAPTYLRVLVSEAGRTPEVSAIFATEILSPILTALARVIERGRAHGAFRAVEPNAAAGLLLAPAIFAGLANEALAAGAALDVDNLLASHADLFLEGLLTG
jgi:AcrR family transcriptional regulator